MKKFVVPIMSLGLFWIVACNNEATEENTEAVDTMELNQPDTSQMNAVTSDHEEFMKKAASGGLMEVELGKYATNNASSPKVKEFGQTMVTDHSKANEELKALAAQKNVSLPLTPMPEHQEHINTLESKKGAEFDKAYMSMMVEDHQHDVEEFEKAANSSSDPEVKAFAAKTVPVLKQHLEMAKSINESLNK